MTTTDGKWTFDVLHAMDEHRTLRPDRNERIAWLERELRILKKRQAKGYGPYPQTIENLKRMLEVLGVAA